MKRIIVFGFVLMVLLTSLVITAYGASDNYKVHNRFRLALFGSPRTYSKPTLGNNDHNYYYRNDKGDNFYLAPPTAEPYYNVQLYKNVYSLLRHITPYTITQYHDLVQEQHIVEDGRM